MEYTQPPAFDKSFEILIIDDDKIGSFILKLTLERLSTYWPIQTFKNGRAALEYLEQRSEKNGKYLLLLDLNMPEMDGWNFLEECEARGLDNLHTVILTSLASPEDKSKALTYPRVVGYFEKPFNMEKADKVAALEELQDFFGKRDAS